MEEAGSDAADTFAHAVAPVGAPSAAAAVLHGEWRGYSKSRIGGTSPQGFSCLCSDKAGNIYFFPLHIRQLLCLLLNVYPDSAAGGPRRSFVPQAQAV
jgi:hypothetical protein